MNLYLREINKNKKSLMIWTAIIVTLVVMVMAFYPTISAETETYERMLESMPKGFTAAFGVGSLSMGNIFGYYAIEGYLMITLLGSIYAVMLASGILSKEESDKTIEFLLSKPITRKEIVTNKLLSYITNIIILNIIATIVLFISFQIFKEDDFNMKTFILISIAPLLLHLVFAAIGFLVSVFITKGKKVTPIALGIVLVTYFMGILAELSDKLEFLKYLSPFKYFEAKDIISNDAIQMKYIALTVIINLVCIVLTYVFYSKKDITV
ncbi:ABC transporter permease subunit [Sporosalibacterium faouarense]|uniref:ABC transporter permease subunit n=1 Tax=Sporosalibacterium faouarense TaxID=516123 RepID=UPI00141D274C|nr:ABC transporter permease subunit [Sporosalibacterium faouarense]MTI47522.1 ABC transporter permease [Bacillota bacterium]